VIFYRVTAGEAKGSVYLIGRYRVSPCDSKCTIFDV
jgi:hypothetical protein